MNRKEANKQNNIGSYNVAIHDSGSTVFFFNGRDSLTFIYTHDDGREFDVSTCFFFNIFSYYSATV